MADEKINRRCRLLSVAICVSIVASDLIKFLFENVTQTKAPEWVSVLHNLIFLALVVAGILQLFTSVYFGELNRLRFSLRGLFISLFALNLFLALWLGTQNDISRIIGMVGVAAWCVITAIWFICSVVEDKATNAPRNEH
jgi:hypothetical protein